MKRKQTKEILVRSPMVTELLEKEVEKCKTITVINVPNLADYSTRFKDIR